MAHIWRTAVGGVGVVTNGFAWGDVVEILMAILVAGMVNAAWEALRRSYWRAKRLRAYEREIAEERKKLMDEEMSE